MNFNKIFILIFLIFCTNSISFSQENHFSNQITVEMRNAAKMTTGLPAHDFYYTLRIPPKEEVEGPTENFIHPNESNIIKVKRSDGKLLNVRLKIIDPAIGNRIIWFGDIYFYPDSQELHYFINQQDNIHYIIKIKISQKNSNDFAIEMSSI